MNMGVIHLLPRDRVRAHVWATSRAAGYSSVRTEPKFLLSALVRVLLR